MRLASTSVVLLFLAACSPSSGDDGSNPAPDAGGAEPDAGEEQPGVVFFRDVKPIIDGRCAGCHTTGGIGPIDLSVPAVVEQAVPMIKAQVDSKLMPPWHAGPNCNTFKNDRSLTPDQIATIDAWIAGGAPMGDPSVVGDPVPPIDVGIHRTDLRIQTQAPYTPTGTDDYRCFVVDWPETTTKYVSGFNLEPSNPAIVHHANLYIASGNGVAAFRALDQQAAGPGYPCFGGAFADGTALLGSWAPGSTGLVYPEGTGIRVDPGSVIVIEMHFNLGENRSGSDRSALALQLEDSVDREALIAPFWNFQEWSQNGNMPIPANDPDVVHSFQLNPDGLIQLFAPWLTARKLKIHGAGLHMHYLGTQGTIRVVRPDSSQQCVLTIPRWDFNWQYGYLHTDPIPFELGIDEIYLECHWDNTAGNQPIVDGRRREVRDVNWGNTSADEMCIGYLYLTAE